MAEVVNLVQNNGILDLISHGVYSCTFEENDDLAEKIKTAKLKQYNSSFNRMFNLKLGESIHDKLFDSDKDLTYFTSQLAEFGKVKMDKLLWAQADNFYLVKLESYLTDRGLETIVEDKSLDFALTQMEERNVHDMNNMLMLLNASCELFKMKQDMSAFNYLNETMKTTREIQNLNTDISHLKKNFKYSLDYVNLPEVLSNYVKEYIPHSDEKIVFNNHANDCKVHSSPKIFSIVFYNLMKNARYFSDKQIELDLYKSYNGARLTIKDDGNGFDPELLQKFQKSRRPTPIRFGKANKLIVNHLLLREINSDFGVLKSDENGTTMYLDLNHFQ